MSDGAIFISHASSDDAFVAELRQALEGQGLSVWVDSRNLRGGAKLAPEIEQAIEQARQVWWCSARARSTRPGCASEIQQALQVEQRPPGRWLSRDPAAAAGHRARRAWRLVRRGAGRGSGRARPGGVERGAAGHPGRAGRAPARPIASRSQAPTAQPVEELLLQLVDPRSTPQEGTRRAPATATLIYEPADRQRARRSRAGGSRSPRRSARSRPTTCAGTWRATTCGRSGVFKERAERIEAAAAAVGPGRCMHAALRHEIAQEALSGLAAAADGAERRFSVLVDGDLPDGAARSSRPPPARPPPSCWRCRGSCCTTAAATCSRASTPCGCAGACRTATPSRSRSTGLPIRILLVSPRPGGRRRRRLHRPPRQRAAAGRGGGEPGRAGRGSPCSRRRPTPRWQQALRERATQAQPFDVVHFDGHGVYDRQLGLGGLCFEDPNDSDKLDERDAGLRRRRTSWPALVRDHRIPLVFLEACQTAQAEDDPTASVAAELLEEGVDLGGGDEPQRAGRDGAPLRPGVLRRAGRAAPGSARPCSPASRRCTTTPAAARSSARASCGCRTGSCRCSTRKSTTRS